MLFKRWAEEDCVCIYKPFNDPPTTSENVCISFKLTTAGATGVTDA